MPTTAILTYAHQFTCQQMDANNTLVGNIVTLQTQKVAQKKHRGRIDLTNALSPAAKAEFGPGVQHASFQIAGIADVSAQFDLIYTTSMDNPIYTWCQFYMAKPAAGFNPVIYSAKVLWEDVELTVETSSEGKVTMFSATGNISGSILVSGTQYTSITGAAG